MQYEGLFQLTKKQILTVIISLITLILFQLFASKLMLVILVIFEILMAFAFFTARSIKITASYEDREYKISHKQNTHRLQKLRNPIGLGEIHGVFWNWVIIFSIVLYPLIFYYVNDLQTLWINRWFARFGCFTVILLWLTWDQRG